LVSAECPRIGLVDNSPIIRETVAIVLGDDFRVEGLTVEEFARDPRHFADADLLILADDVLSALPAGAVAVGPPILWLQSRAAPPPRTAGSSTVIARAFSPEQLLAEVQALLTHRERVGPITTSLSIADYPLLPKDIPLLVRRAVATRFPVLICGEPGTGKARLARAIHSLGDDGRFVALSAAGCTRAALQQAASLASGNLTVFVADIAALGADAQHLLRELLDCGGFESDRGGHRVRLIGATTRSLDALARVQEFDKELFYRLSVLPIALPPLRERAADIPVLVEHFAAELARSMGGEPATFTKRALERLTHYLWFGNLAELETVLARSVALAPGRAIDAEDLLFGYGRIVPRARDQNGKPRREAAPHTDAGGAVDLIINELAHEFKNPMATIKTIAQQLERLLEDEAGREQVAQLTGEAVDRMDRALENLLQFTRFRTPAPQEVTLNAMLAPCLSDLTTALSERRVLLNYRPPEPTPVFVDAEQVSYAFENLLHTIARDLGENHKLSIHQRAGSGAITFDFSSKGHPVAGKLGELLDHSANGDQPALPLGLVFAKTLIERNGGHIEVRSAGGTTSITVSLPRRDEMVTGNEKATNPDR
jgi:two-component system, NtrC family, response regulator HydG